MSYFFEKIKIIFKKFFSGHFITNPTSKWTFFSKKYYNLILNVFFDICVTNIYNLILNVFLHLCNYYILCHIFLKKLKSFLKKLKKFFSGHFITKKNPTSKWTFFSKKKLQFDFKCVFTSV